MLYFDLDGVIRDLCTLSLGYPPDHWWHRKEGKNLVDYINEDLSILTRSGPTEYYPIIRKLPELNIITHQPEHWKARTTEWIAEHFPGVDVNVLYVNSPEEKLAYMCAGEYLVEDYPLFQDYSHIALINRPYNRQAAAPVRICSPAELEEFINGKVR